MNQKQNKIFNTLIWACMNKTFAQILSTLVSIILARLLSPENYGVVSVALIFINFLNVLVEPGLNSALVRKKDPDSIDFSSMFYFDLLIGFCLYVLIFAFSPYLEIFWNEDGLSSVIRILALKIPLTSISSIQRTYIQKNLLYKKNIIISSLSTIISAVVVIMMVTYGFDVWALVVQIIVNCIAEILLSFIFIPWRPTTQFSMKRLSALLAFGKNMLFAKLVDVAYVELSATLLGKKYTTENLSYYNKGKMFPQLIMNTAHSAVADVMFTVLSNEQDEISKLKKMMQKTIQMSNYVIFPLLSGMMLCSPKFVEFFLTEKWLPSVPYIQIMCLYNMFLPTSSAIYQTIKAMGKSNIIFILECLKKTMGCLLMIVATLLFERPIFIAYSLLINIILSTALDLIISYKYIGYTFVQFIKENIKIIVLNGVMGMTVHFAGTISGPLFIVLLTQVAIGIVVYLIFSKVFKVDEFNVLIRYLLNKVKHNSEEDYFYE